MADPILGPGAKGDPANPAAKPEPESRPANQGTTETGTTETETDAGATTETGTTETDVPPTRTRGRNL